MLILDIFVFCRSGEQRSGKLVVSELPRLRAECTTADGQIEWALVGSISERVNGYPTLYLTVKGAVQLVCQRCLTPYMHQVQSNSNILLVKDEQTADQLESFLEDDEIEVVIGSKTFDVAALIEDEVLLALPIAPKHEVCPNDVKMDKSVDTESNAKKESPFAVLKDQLEKK